MTELLPCPFCGATPKQPECFSRQEGGKWGLVQCTNCGAQSSDVRTGYGPVDEWAEDAAKEWNCRATRPATDEEVARVLMAGNAGTSAGWDKYPDLRENWFRWWVPQARAELARLGLSIVANSTPEQPT